MDVKGKLVEVIQDAKAYGIPKNRTCAVLQIHVRRIERWVIRHRKTGSMLDFKSGPKQHLHAIMPHEREAVLDYVQEEETVDYSIRMIALKGAERGLFYVSSATVRMILLAEGLLADRRPPVRRIGAGIKPNRPEVLTGPNQCWSWDISYLKTDLKRIFWFLWVMLDEWSRKVVAFIISQQQTREEAQSLIDVAYVSEGLFDRPLEKLPVIVNDRGSPMKAKPVQQMLRDLGLVQTFSRPRTPNDNPFIEALFSTVKTAPGYPGWFPSESIQPVQEYFERYFHWYNYEHFHSGIGYVHPIDQHEGRAEAILKERKKRLIGQRNQRRLYWSNQNHYQLTGNGL